MIRRCVSLVAACAVAVLSVLTSAHGAAADEITVTPPGGETWPADLTSFTVSNDPSTVSITLNRAESVTTNLVYVYFYMDTNGDGTVDTTLEVRPTVTALSITGFGPRCAQDPRLSSSVTPTVVQVSFAWSCLAEAMPDPAMFAPSDLSLGIRILSSRSVPEGLLFAEKVSRDYLLVNAPVIPLAEPTLLDASFGLSLQQQNADGTVPGTFTVAAPDGSVDAPAASGTIEWTLSGIDQTPLDVIDGSAEFTTTALEPGSYSFEVNYSGDDAYNPATVTGVISILEGPQAPGTTETVTQTVTVPVPAQPSTTSQIVPPSGGSSIGEIISSTAATVTGGGLNASTAASGAQAVSGAATSSDAQADDGSASSSAGVAFDAAAGSGPDEDRDDGVLRAISFGIPAALLLGVGGIVLWTRRTQTKISQLD